MEALLQENRRAIDESSGTEIGNLNRQFHHRIRTAAGNRFVAERVEPLIGRLMWAFSESPDPERVWRGHRLLLAAIAARDEEAAVRAAHADNEHNRQIALEQLSDSTSKAW
jgi:DNA-binding GntR family transcriptional regulator